MILRKNGKIASDNSQETSTSSEFKEYSDDLHYDDNLLMVTRCLALGNMFSVIIDKNSCMNIASERLYDMKVIHDGVTNRFTFVHMGQKIVFKPLSPKRILGRSK
ncbi:hypothetical protein CR513_34725, partial [Mucuna pruriens]